MSAYLSAVLADSPIHYWRMADPGGSLTHDIGSSPRAMATNNFATVVPYTGPISDGGSAWFDALTTVNFFDSDSRTTPCSSELWVWQHYTRNAFQGLFSMDVPGVTALCDIGINATGHPQANVAVTSITSASVMSIQNWHHLVVTRTASLSTLYVDAISVGTVATGTQAAANFNMCIGAYLANTFGNTTVPASANIAEVAFYGTALSASAVTTHFVAADNVSSKPVSQISGVGSPNNGNANTSAAALQQILNAVMKTY